MSLPLTAQVPPLRHDGLNLRVGGSNVALEVVLAAFKAGSSPERIVEQHPTLDLADVYDVVAYYLRHKTELDAYLDAQQASAEASEVETRRQCPNSFTRTTLEVRTRP